MSILGLLTMPSAAAAVAGFLSIDSCYQQLPQLGCMLLFAWISHYYQLYMISICLYPVTCFHLLLCFFCLFRIVQNKK